MMPPTKVNKRYIKHGYLDKNAGFIKLDRLLFGNANYKPALSGKDYTHTLRLVKPKLAPLSHS
jgi:hypothetical protein